MNIELLASMFDFDAHAVVFDALEVRDLFHRLSTDESHWIKGDRDTERIMHHIISMA